MKTYALTSVLLILFSFSVFAQESSEKEKQNCPTVTLEGPATAIDLGEPHIFTVNVSGGSVDKTKLGYKWSVDKGKIISGQDTQTITISTKGLEDTTINATVKISGLPDGCVNEFSEASITICPADPILVDEFGNIQSGDMKARLDNFFVGLQDDPTSTGYVVNYGTARNIARRERFIRNYIKLRNFDAARIVIKKGGREKSIRTRLWIAPAGANPELIN